MTTKKGSGTGLASESYNGDEEEEEGMDGEKSITYFISCSLLILLLFGGIEGGLMFVLGNYKNTVNRKKSKKQIEEECLQVSGGKWLSFMGEIIEKCIYQSLLSFHCCFYRIIEINLNIFISLDYKGDFRVVNKYSGQPTIS